ncbi:serine/threonine protein kinase [Nostoc sphaeroides CHAB 2801]|uniref:serine/threonine-protein kinase n=1 Tax=Nostoc sphaeroides TaxID=446679 RepID=UPI000E4B43BF|nr:serine/threonine-protein kinase [Nostoc sphaeroides]MCC5634066.1 serine/threonine protein kinase [Nostoc sphaeroides CHAB 2801]
MGLIVGNIVGGHYKVIRTLGSGNFGETYLAEDLYARNRKCAVKRFNFASNDPDTFNKAKELFQREAKVLFDLSNPLRNDRIPQFFADFDDNKEFYLVQEFIEGHNLGQELQKITKLEEDKVVDLLEEVLEILKFIHSKKIIHRDIKPENLMRRVPDNKIVLIDFGAVKEVVAQSANTTLGKKPTRIYTEDYAPREQRQGKPRLNSDIYALGITALQALAGLDIEHLKDTKTGEVIWGSQIQVSKGLEKILKRMVHEDYNRRYQLADDVLHAIKKYKKQYKKTWILSPGNSQPLTRQQPTRLVTTIPLRWRFVVGMIGMVTVFTISFVVFRTVTTKSPNSTVSPDSTTTKSPPKSRGNCPPFIAPGDDCLP